MTRSIATKGYQFSLSQSFKALCFGIICSFVLYSYAIASTTLTIASAEDMNHDIAALQTDIAELELHYYSMVNDISLKGAERLGLSEASSVEYAKIAPETTVAYNL